MLEIDLHNSWGWSTRILTYEWACSQAITTKKNNIWDKQKYKGSSTFVGGRRCSGAWKVIKAVKNNETI